jgi:hypothetical protein
MFFHNIWIYAEHEFKELMFTNCIFINTASVANNHGQGVLKVGVPTESIVIYFDEIGH